eukprot:CAMPEP_0185575708 /NCGR_PEP_ID=MMETSP0434-20130131/6825_1 /TAXON_ID=626734 ORGANISM="Favella taraikaensis, Strain Fe Narragansett Bay" /NCGR_SAMPLE_ID=MMETSP0434 /ASSEMBLY_ACC=CAM_ASM_000379 /LENGTH=92 /DNA_ID=CAMNT_0028192653 /DNA_START=2430 /DNA_END=2708 /DNA_ORIENTATION=-
MQDELGQPESLTNDDALQIVALHVDGQRGNQPDHHAEHDLRLFNQIAHLEALDRAVLLEHCVQVMELRTGAPPLLAVGLNSVQQDFLLVQDH